MHPNVISIILSARSDSRSFLILTIAVVGGLIYFLNWISGGRITAYYTRPKEQSNALTMAGLHLILSALLSLFLTNVVLSELPFFKELFAADKNWVPITILGLLVFFIVTLGLVFSAFNAKPKEPKN